MVNETLTGNVPAAKPAINYHDRTIRLNPPKNAFNKLARGLFDWFERRVAGVSVNPDLHVYDNKTFPWAADVESDWKLVRAELDQVMKFRDQMPSFQDILKEVGNIQTDDQWKTYFLMGIGMDCTENAKRCPETMRVLNKIPGVKTAFFSILSPKKHIPAHRGAFNGVLRLHLALLVPEPREQVRIRIGNDIYNWTEGKALIFDDTYNHEVWNDTDGYRVVLFVDFARPLKSPWNKLLDGVLNMASLAPFLREAGMKQKKWEKKMGEKK
ncbi:MAG: aspartyl/asparaginyl beta-hydroxylase domain-containing protein [Verrucomicrobiota bacterium]